MKHRRSYPVVCHPTRPHGALGLCRACWQFWRRAKDGPASDRLTDLQKIVDGHEERKTAAAAAHARQQVATKQRDPQRYIRGRNKALRERYGITVDDYARILAEQNGGCAVCGREPTETRPLHVDHRHDNQVVRGLLCSRCNTMVAALDVEPALLSKLTAYSKRGRS